MKPGVGAARSRRCSQSAIGDKPSPGRVGPSRPAALGAGTTLFSSFLASNLRIAKAVLPDVPRGLLAFKPTWAAAFFLWTRRREGRLAARRLQLAHAGQEVGHAQQVLVREQQLAAQARPVPGVDEPGLEEARQRLPVDLVDGLATGLELAQPPHVARQREIHHLGGGRSLARLRSGGGHA